MKNPWILASCCLAFAPARAAEPATRQVTFQVEVREKPAEDESVYVAGSVPALGEWKADGLKLEPSPDGNWSATVALPADMPIEFKITKGSWERERLLADGAIPGNEVIGPGEGTNVHVVVHRWKKPGPPPPPQITGDYRLHDAVPSAFLKHDRKVIVWLPPSYEHEKARRYPVLYMHDGQQVFDPQTSTHGQDWELDEWCTKLIAEDRIEEIIVVGVYSTSERFQEYSPSIEGTNYARFLVEELKPFVDREYRTKPGRESTAVAGASMGGKISFHLAWAHPDVYFGAACLSPTFDYKGDRQEPDQVIASTSAPDLRLYLYCGEGDPLEQKIIPGMREMARLLRERGFRDGENLLVVEDAAAPHNEAAWQKYTGQWLEFLFGRERDAAR